MRGSKQKVKKPNKYPKNAFLGHKSLFQKSGPDTFVCLWCPDFMQKHRKI